MTKNLIASQIGVVDGCGDGSDDGCDVQYKLVALSGVIVYDPFNTDRGVNSQPNAITKKRRHMFTGA